jgi:hypothetical protein
MSGPVDQVARVMTLLERLSALLDAEIGLLRRMQLTGLAELLAEKEQLTIAYERELRALRREPEVLGGLAGERRRALEAAIRDFQTRLAASRRQSAAARQVLEDIVRLVAASAAPRAGAPAGYGPACGGPQRQPGAVPVALNRRI